MRYRVHKIWPQRPAVTLTFDLQNLIKSSGWAGGYSLPVLSKLFKQFMRYFGNSIWSDKRTDKQESLKTLSGGERKQELTQQLLRWSTMALVNHGTEIQNFSKYNTAPIAPLRRSSFPWAAPNPI